MVLGHFHKVPGCPRRLRVISRWLRVIFLTRRDIVLRHRIIFPECRVISRKLRDVIVSGCDILLRRRGISPSCRETATTLRQIHVRFTGSMSTASVTSSGSASDATIFASAWLNLLIARVRSMIW